MGAIKGTLPPNAGKGRGKGNTNKINKELKDLIRGALDDAGGQKYLTRQANENPVAFMTLLGKIVPKDINNNVTGLIAHKVVFETIAGVKPGNTDTIDRTTD